MKVSEDDLARLVRSIWETQLGLELDGVEAASLDEALSTWDTVTFGVRFSGNFEGTLIQSCSRRVALLAAAAAFARSDKQLGASDARDAIAELAHMTAGNLKIKFAGTSAVSLPDAINPQREHGKVVARVGFLLHGEPLVVMVIE
jgi:chemotaxis protein CheX